MPDLQRSSDIDQDLSLDELPLGNGIDEEETIESSEVIHEPFDPTLIRVEASTPTIDLLVRRMRHGEINLAPDFQRKGGLWNNDTQSRLIESILIRIPLPAFYVDATSDSFWIVVDGLQRLTTLKRFIVDEDLVLRGLEFLRHLEGKRYSELPRNFQRRIDETQVTIFSIQAGTPEKVKFNIFKRINTGGLPLSAQEIRNALNGDRVRQFLKRLATSDVFLRATRGAIKDLRMADRECVTRFLAFNLREPKDFSAKDFDSFLNEIMAELNKASEDRLQELENRFNKAMSAAERIFGKYAFRKFYGIGLRLSPINKAVFEAWSVNLGQLDGQQIEKLVISREELLDRLANLMKDAEFQASISQGTGDPSKIRLRFARTKAMIDSTLAEA